MTTAIEFALMAGHAYRATCDKVNWLPAPQGWTSFAPVIDPSTPGFPTTNNGGDGYDTYIIEGSGTIEDGDGKGFIIKDQAGNILSGLIEKRQDGSYVFLADTTVSVTKNADLTPFGNGNSITIQSFADGQLGLVCSLWNGVANDARYGNSFDRRVV